MLKFFFKRNLNDEQKLYFDLMVNCYKISLYKSNNERPQSLQYRKISLSLLIFFFIVFLLSNYNILGCYSFISFLFHYFSLISILVSGLYMFFNYKREFNFLLNYNFVECNPILKKSVISFLFWEQICFFFFFIIFIIINFFIFYDYTFLKFKDTDFFRVY